MFDLKKDPQELHDIADCPAYADLRCRAQQELIRHLYGNDLQWVRDNTLCGITQHTTRTKRPDYGMCGQRGLHWPPPCKKEPK